MKTITQAIGFVVALGALFVSTSTAQVTCGTTITDAQTMTGDLTCMTTPAFIIDSGGSVDMGGHTLTVGGSEGVSFTGTGGGLFNGAIVSGGSPSYGIQLAGDSHKISNIRIEGIDPAIFTPFLVQKTQIVSCILTNGGINVTGNNNILAGTSVKGAGVALSGANLLIKDNVVSGASGDGFNLYLDDSTLKHNVSIGNGKGFHIEGFSTKAIDNTASHNSGVGFEIRQYQAKLTKNVALDNGQEGFLILGSSHKATKCVSHGNGGEGFSVTALKTQLIACKAVDNGSDGFRIDQSLAPGDANALKSNIAMGNSGDGIHLLTIAVPNTLVEKSLAFGNLGSDLHSDEVTCGTAVWRKNTFGTSDAAGTGSPPCIQ